MKKSTEIMLRSSCYKVRPPFPRKVIAILAVGLLVVVGGLVLATTFGG